MGIPPLRDPSAVAGDIEGVEEKECSRDTIATNFCTDLLSLARSAVVRVERATADSEATGKRRNLSEHENEGYPNLTTKTIYAQV